MAYAIGHVSGCHLNPAVTLAFAVRRRFPWPKVLPYWVAQVAGAFVGAALVYGVYHDAINTFDHAMKGPKTNGHTLASFSIFGTFPAAYFHGGTWGPLVDQIVGTAFLVMFIFAVTDDVNQPVRANLTPVVVGFIVVAIGLSFGANAGYAINPARDFGPRVFAFLAGWGKVALPGVDNYFWVPIIGPLVGAVIAAFVYHHLIYRVLVTKHPEQPPSVPERAPTT